MRNTVVLGRSPGSSAQPAAPTRFARRPVEHFDADPTAWGHRTVVGNEDFRFAVPVEIRYYWPTNRRISDDPNRRISDGPLQRGVVDCVRPENLPERGHSRQRMFPHISTFGCQHGELPLAVQIGDHRGTPGIEAE